MSTFLKTLFLSLAFSAHAQTAIKGDSISLRPVTVPASCLPGKIILSVADSKIKICSAGSFVDIGAGIYSTPIAVAEGGTGVNTIPARGVMIGQGTSPIATANRNAVGAVLYSQAGDPVFSTSPTLGLQTSATGTLGFSGTTSGTVTVKPDDAAGTYNFILPQTAGSSSNVLTSAGGVASPMTWTAAIDTNTASAIVKRDGSGNFSAGTITANVTGTSSIATNTTITDDTTTNGTEYLTWVTAATGNLPQKVSSTKLSFNPSTGMLTSTGVSSVLTATGNINLGSYYLSGDGGTEGLHVDNSGGVVVLHASNTPTLTAAAASTTFSIYGGNTSVSPGGSNTAGGKLILLGGVGTGIGTSNIETWVPVLKASGSTAQDTVQLVTTIGNDTGTHSHLWILDALWLGGNGGNTATIQMNGTTSGTVTVKPADIAGTYNFVLPITVGSSSDVLTSAAGSAMTWTAATSAATNSAIVKRDGSGNFSATTVTAALTGTASGNLTATASNHGILVSGAANAATVLAVGSTGQMLQGASASDPAWSHIPTLGGVPGTGKLQLSGTTSGTVGLTVADAAGTYNYILPITSGAAGQLLVSGGGGSTAMTWADHGAINFITNSAAEVGTTGWATYFDAAATSPVNGTGGSPTVTWTRATSTPLTETGNFLFTKDSANRQGEGASFDFTIDNASQAKVLSVEFDYLVGSGTFVAGTSSVDSDIEIFLYDVTNSVLIEPSTKKLYSNSSTVPSHFVSNFQTASNSTSYRLIFHTATTSASAYTVKFDSISVSPSKYVYGTPITDWISYTPTTAGWVDANHTTTGYWRRVGGDLQSRVHIALTGAPTTATLTVNYLPSGLTVDTARLPTANTVMTLGYGSTKSGGNNFDLTVLYASTTTITPIAKLASGTYAGAAAAVTQAIPGTYANADSVDLFIHVPITGWSATVQMSDSADQREVSARYSNTAGTSIANSGDIVVPFATKDYDTHSAFVTDTYTIPVAGRYRVTCVLNYASSLYAASNQSYTLIYKNGALAAYGPLNLIGGTPTGVLGSHISAQLNLVAGDAIVCRANNQRTAGATLLSTTAGENYFQIEKLGGPSSIGATELIAARYTNTAGTSITNSGADIAIPFATKDYDTHGGFVTDTYTIPAAGKYKIGCNTNYASSLYAAANVLTSSVYKNGAAVAFGPAVAMGGAVTDLVGVASTALLNLVAGDSIVCRSSNNRTAGATLLNTTAGTNSFEIQRVGL